MSRSEKDAAPMNTAELLASKNYIGKKEFLVDGQLVERRLTIEAVLLVEQDWHGKGDDKDLVIAFKGKKKRWIVNKTNKNAIARIHGAGEVAKVWLGKTLTLFWTETEPSTGKKIRNPSGGPPGGVRVKGK